jgi:hypothetical protein
MASAHYVRNSYMRLLRSVLALLTVLVAVTHLPSPVPSILLRVRWPACLRSNSSVGTISERISHIVYNHSRNIAKFTADSGKTEIRKQRSLQTTHTWREERRRLLGKQESAFFRGVSDERWFPPTLLGTGVSSSKSKHGPLHAKKTSDTDRNGASNGNRFQGNIPQLYPDRTDAGKSYRQKNRRPMNRKPVSNDNSSVINNEKRLNPAAPSRAAVGSQSVSQETLKSTRRRRRRPKGATALSKVGAFIPAKRTSAEKPVLPSVDPLLLRMSTRMSSPDPDRPRTMTSPQTTRAHHSTLSPPTDLPSSSPHRRYTLREFLHFETEARAAAKGKS